MRTPQITHRVWYDHAARRLNGRRCEHCAHQFVTRLARLVADYEREQEIDPETLEALRSRELSKLLAEAHP